MSSSNDNFVCSHCGRSIPIINQVLHQLHCRGRLPTSNPDRGSRHVPEAVASTAAAVEQHLPVANEITYHDSSIPVAAAVPTNGSSNNSNIEVVDMVEDDLFWKCEVCTFHNYDLTNSTCEACGTHYGIRSTVGNNNSSNNGNTHHRRNSPPIATAPPLPSLSSSSSAATTGNQTADYWECSHCTCRNELVMDHCQACENLRPPQASHSERLIDSDINIDNENVFVWSESIHYGGASYGGADSSRRNNNTSNDDHEPSPLTTNLASSALLGAGLGAGLALLQRRSVMRGALEGMGLGLVGGIAAHALVDDDPILPPPTPSSSSSSSNPAPASSSSSSTAANSNARSAAAASGGGGGGGLSDVEALQNYLRMMEADMQELINAALMGGANGRNSSSANGSGAAAVATGMSERQITALPSFTYHRSPAARNQQNNSATQRNTTRTDNKSSASSSKGSSNNTAAISAPAPAFVAAAEEELCSICLEAFNEGDYVRQLPCKHIFHARCIDFWLRRHGACPMCKQAVRSR